MSKRGNIYLIKSNQSLQAIKKALGADVDIVPMKIKDIQGPQADFVDWASCVGCQPSRMGGSRRAK